MILPGARSKAQLPARCWCWWLTLSLSLSLLLVGIEDLAVAGAFVIREPVAPHPTRRRPPGFRSPPRRKLSARRNGKSTRSEEEEEEQTKAAEDARRGRRAGMPTPPDGSRAVAAAAAALAIFGSSLPVAAAGSVGGGGGGGGENPEYLPIGERDVRIQSNKKLIDYAVGTVNTQFYDSSGGARFNPSDFYRQWKDVQKAATGSEGGAVASSSIPSSSPAARNDLRIDTRDGTVETLRYLVSTLNDPYSRYMTREELRYELKGTHHGFLGTGAYIEVPHTAGSSKSSTTGTLRTSVSTDRTGDGGGGSIVVEPPRPPAGKKKPRRQLLTNTMVANLPVVTAVAPNSPAERAGLVVGDRIVGVGDKDSFLGYGRDEIFNCLSSRWGYPDAHRKDNVDDGDGDDDEIGYFGVADLTIAKPVYSYSHSSVAPAAAASDEVASSGGGDREIVLGYRSTKAKLPTIATSSSNGKNFNSNLRGDAAVQYELLSPSSSIEGGLLGKALGSSEVSSTEEDPTGDNDNGSKVGYIRLTRFSKSSTEGYLRAVRALEEEGADSYVLDLRNNYGGVIQEAMLTASTLLGDPHAILCYLLNARGGFTPVDVESYVVDARYPGYLLTREDKLAVLEQVAKENPAVFRVVSSSSDGDGGGEKRRRLVATNWDPPSSYASIHEQVVKRGIHRITYADYETTTTTGGGGEEETTGGAAAAAFGIAPPRTAAGGGGGGKSLSNQNLLPYRKRMLRQKLLQKDIAVLINEGTASSSEFFVAALRDNGRVDVVGTKSFGKGIIQHTFPMPDGGGLKLTIGEFLRPSLKHVTNTFGVGFVDKATGEITGGGGVDPDVYCESGQGIPGNPRSDLCVKVAVDVLEERRSSARTAPTATTTTTVASGATASAPTPSKSAPPLSKALSSR